MFSNRKHSYLAHKAKFLGMSKIGFPQFYRFRWYLTVKLTSWTLILGIHSFKKKDGNCWSNIYFENLYAKMYLSLSSKMFTVVHQPARTLFFSTSVRILKWQLLRIKRQNVSCPVYLEKKQMILTQDICNSFSLSTGSR